MTKLLAFLRGHTKPFILTLCVALLITTQHLVATGAKTPSPPCASSLGQCPLQGCSSSNSPFAPYDSLLNVQKNHSDGPAETGTDEYTVADMMDESKLPVHHPSTPSAKDLRKAWINAPEGRAISAFEAKQATLIGYIARAKPGDAESCNCELAGPTDVDTHVNVVDKPADPNPDPKLLAAKSVIAEVTWRVRNNDHTDWTTDNLEQLSITKDGLKVRITGDLLYDNVHWDMIHKGYRGTLWEIHPIRRIQVWLNGKWVDYSANMTSQLQVALRAQAAHSGAMTLQAPKPLVGQWRPQWTKAQLKEVNQAFGTDHS